MAGELRHEEMRKHLACRDRFKTNLQKAGVLVGEDRLAEAYAICKRMQDEEGMTLDDAADVLTWEQLERLMAHGRRKPESSP